ncbi:MAG: PAS domain S-box protein, partial [Parafilimonas sp.]
MHSYSLVDQTTQASLQFDKFFLSLRDAAVGYRDYITLHKQNSLDDFNKNIKEYPQIIDRLRQLEAGNVQQEKDIDHLNLLAQNYVNYISHLLELSKTQTIAEPMLNQGRDMLNNIRAEVNKITDREAEILQQRDSELNHHIYTTPLLLLVFSMLSLAIIIYSFTSIIKQIKRAQSLQASETRFKMLIKQAPVAITIYKGVNSIIEIINDQALKILGMTSKEVTGKPLFETIPASQYVKKIHDEVFSTGKTFTASEFMIQLIRNGELTDCYFDLVYEPLFDDNKKITGIITVGTEITDKVLTRKKVEESKNRFRALVENSTDIIALCDEKGAFNYVSDSIKNILGYDEAELLGRRALEFVHPDDIPALIENSMAAVENKKIARNTVRFLHKNGNWRWVESTVSNMLEVPYVNAFVSNMHDVTEQKNIQDDLKQSEENFRQLADLIPQIVWTAKTDGYIDYYNKRWYEYTGFSGDVEKQSWMPILHPDDIQACIGTWYNSIKTGEPYQVQYRLKDKDGGYKWFLGKALPIKDDEGVIIKWFGTCTDIQDQKTITEKLEQLVKARAAELTSKNKDLNEAQ